MRKIFVIITVLVLFLANSTLRANSSEFEGRWAEKTSERVVMDIYSNHDNTEYKIFITWREDNLAQKDIYRFSAKPDGKDYLKYKNGIHIYRYFDKDKFEDKLDYKDGTGTIIVNNNELLWVDNKDNSKTLFIRANKDLTKDTTIKNKLFSITLPEELKGFYEVKKEKDKICIYHKESKKAGFGGFAFGIKMFKNPSDHAMLPGGTKIGELTDKKGKIYDAVLKYPTDVQHDYTKSEQAPESYELLYNLGEYITIKGIKGAQYFKNKGMKGKDLYKEVLKKHIQAIKEAWKSDRLENEDMSHMYYCLYLAKQNVLNKIGYAYYDVNKDGIDELLIGEIAYNNRKGVIYDIYTMVNRSPVHVISGASRNRYYVCDNAFICNEYSSGALESGVRVYNLVENSTELFPQVRFKYDGYENIKNPWFISYGSDEDEKWENVPEKKYKERIKVFKDYERFDFIPLSKVKL